MRPYRIKITKDDLEYPNKMLIGNISLYLQYYKPTTHSIIVKCNNMNKIFKIDFKFSQYWCDCQIYIFTDNGWNDFQLINYKYSYFQENYEFDADKNHEKIFIDIANEILKQINLMFILF